MKWLSLTGQMLGFAGAILAFLFPLEVQHGIMGELGPPPVQYEDGPPRLKQALQQMRATKGGLLFVAAGFLLQALGTILGL